MAFQKAVSSASQGQIDTVVIIVPLLHSINGRRYCEDRVIERGLQIIFERIRRKSMLVKGTLMLIVKARERSSKFDHILSLIHSMILNSSGRWLILLRVIPRSFSRPSFRLQINPCILNSCPLSHASCTMGILATLYTCCFTLSSASKFSFSSGVSAFNSFLYLALMSRIWDSQASSGPWSCFLKAARMPPQPQCPAMMISFTFSTCTEYWTTARTLMSEGGAWLAMFLWTKSSPGCRPTIQLAGTRESEQPIQRYSGDWTIESRQKQSGSSSIFASDQMRLLCMMA